MKSGRRVLHSTYLVAGVVFFALLLHVKLEPEPRRAVVTSRARPMRKAEERVELLRRREGSRIGGGRARRRQQHVAKAARRHEQVIRANDQGTCGWGRRGPCTPSLRRSLLFPLPPALPPSCIPFHLYSSRPSCTPSLRPARVLPRTAARLPQCHAQRVPGSSCSTAHPIHGQDHRIFDFRRYKRVKHASSMNRAYLIP